MKIEIDTDDLDTVSFHEYPDGQWSMMVSIHVYDAKTKRKIIQAFKRRLKNGQSN